VTGARVAKRGEDDWQLAELSDHLQGLKSGNRAVLKDRAIQELSKAIGTGRLIAFTGSFATVANGYPDWSDFLQNAIGTSSASSKNAFEEGLRADLKKRGETSLWAFEFLNLLGSDEAESRKRWSRFFKMTRASSTIPGLSATDAIIRILGINRIITLNYDLEAEFAMLPRSTSRKPGKNGGPWDYFEKNWQVPDDEKIKQELGRSDSSFRKLKYMHDGRAMVSDVFSRERTDRLFEFALNSSSFAGHVMHLHGRADQPQTMIVAYSDYEELYRRSSLTKLPFEHAMRSLYAGNPIIFIGLGMSEDELLFHLRQFVSDGNPRYLAPRFVLWSPRSSAFDKVAADKKNESSVGQFRRAKDGVSLDDEKRRVRWFREYGVYTIFDTEIDGYTTHEDSIGKTGNRKKRIKDGKNGQLARSVGLVGGAVAEQLRPYSWAKNQFRSMRSFLGENDRILTELGAHIWRTEDVYVPYIPGWKLSTSPDRPIVEPRGETEAEPGDYLTEIIDHGAPIKAWLDVPGSGHGYIAQLLRDLIIRRESDRKDDPTAYKVPSVLAKINAGFAWELDSTFELLTGLYDGNLSFEEGKSRQNAMARFLSDLLKDGKNRKRNIVLIINGADRFFDTDGYPLSADLDNLVRTIPMLTSKADPEQPNPVSLFLFGTGRVARYLSRVFCDNHLEDKEESIVRYLGGLQPPFDGEGARRKSPVTSGRKQSWSNEKLETSAFADPTFAGYLQREWDEAEGKIARARIPIQFPAAQMASEPAPEFRSAYLRATEAMLLELIPKGVQNPVAGTHRFELERTRRFGPRGQRRAFFNAYCNVDVLAWVLRENTTRSRLNAQDFARAKLALAIMRTMAFIGQPVEVSTIQCCEAVRSQMKDSNISSGLLSVFLERLAELGLIIQIANYPDSPQNEYSRYGLHRSMLHEIRDRYTIPISDARTYASFNIPLYMAQPAEDNEPSDDAYDRLTVLIDALIVGNHDDNCARYSPTSYALGMCLRAATASVRSYFTTSTMLMHQPDKLPSEAPSPRLSSHCRQLERLIKAFEKNAEGLVNPDEARQCVFPDDLVWLHDQRGVALLAQGSLYEAQNAFRSARRLNSQWVEPDDRLVPGHNGFHGQNWRRISINEVHVDIERGRVDEAADKLRAIEQSIEDLCDSVLWRHRFPKIEGRDEPFRSAFATIVDRYGQEGNREPRRVDPFFPAEAILLAGLVCHYRSWCTYISGKLKTAQTYSSHAVNILLNLGEQRAYAMALRMQGAILRGLGEVAASKHSLHLCLAAADEGRQMDLSHCAVVELVELDIDHPDKIGPGGYSLTKPDTLKKLNTTLRYATLTEMYRVRLEVRMVLAKLRKATGDYDGALEHAADALAIAMRYGFALRKISLRNLIGEILILRGDPISGTSMLNQARAEGERIGYQRAVDAALDKLLYFSS
jgi:tetratricopeptide (TPR) repeat protein